MDNEATDWAVENTHKSGGFSRDKEDAKEATKRKFIERTAEERGPSL